MKPRTVVAGLVALLVLTVLGIGGVIAAQGASERVLNGFLVGAGLGGLSLLIESFSLVWALKKKPSVTLALSLVGFTSRLVLVCVLTLVLRESASVDAVTFALTYVASFLLFVGVQILAVSRLQRKAGSPQEGTE